MTVQDDVVAAAVLIIEAMLADDWCRDVWRECSQNQERQHGDPKKFLKREITRFENEEYETLKEIVKVISEIADGTVTTLQPLIEAVLKAGAPFYESAKKHNWVDLAYHGDSQAISGQSIDFIAGETFVE